MLQAVNISNQKLKSSNFSERKNPLRVFCNMDNTVLECDAGELLEYRHLIRQPHFLEYWGKSYGKELGRFFQGIFIQFNGTNRIVFIHKQEVPND